MSQKIQKHFDEILNYLKMLNKYSRHKGRWAWLPRVLALDKNITQVKESVKQQNQKIYSEIMGLEMALQAKNDNGDYCNIDSVNRDKIKARIANIKSLLIGCACLFFMVLLSLGNHEPRRTGGSSRGCSRTIRREVMA